MITGVQILTLVGSRGALLSLVTVLGVKIGVKTRHSLLHFGG
jgi:hypothetical protein